MITKRFWVYVNDGPVRLSIKPGQELHWSTWGRTDEGWSSEAQTWRWPDEDSPIENEMIDDGRDCDGRLTRHHSSVMVENNVRPSYCRWDKFNGNQILYPEWKTVDSGQRDEYAEAMGY